MSTARQLYFCNNTQCAWCVDCDVIAKLGCVVKRIHQARLSTQSISKADCGDSLLLLATNYVG
jgi:hypothetical protein